MTTAAKQDSDVKAIFRRFTEAAADLIECCETPEEVTTAVLEAVTDMGTCHPEDVDSNYVRRTLSRVFGLGGGEDEAAGENEAAARSPAIQPSPNGRRPSNEDRENFRRLAEAFAILFELQDYLPELFCRNLHDTHAGIIDQANLSDPAVVRATLPILAECGGVEFEDEEGGDTDANEE